MEDGKNFEKKESYKLLREFTDEKNKMVEPYKPRKKKIHQLFNLKKT